MIPKQCHFHLRQHPHFFQTSRQVRLAPFVVYWQQNNTTQTKIAVVVPKTTTPLATGRNLIKRKIFAAFTRMSSTPEGYTVVIRCTNGIMVQPISWYEKHLQLLFSAITTAHH